MDENAIGDIIVNEATLIHRQIGPGLLESVYETLLAEYLRRRSLLVRRQVRVPLKFDGLEFEEAFRADLIIEDKVILELKCVDSINNSHRKQLLTYLRLTGMRLGYLLNFNESLMKNGINRTVNNLLD